MHAWHNKVGCCLAVIAGLSSAAVAAPDADSYIRRGLIAQWDGIDNVGTGEYDAGATTWVDAGWKHPGIAAHPGDRGMAEIARQILGALFPMKRRGNGVGSRATALEISVTRFHDVVADNAGVRLGTSSVLV